MRVLKIWFLVIVAFCSSFCFASSQSLRISNNSFIECNIGELIPLGEINRISDSGIGFSGIYNLNIDSAMYFSALFSYNPFSSVTIGHVQYEYKASSLSLGARYNFEKNKLGFFPYLGADMGFYKLSKIEICLLGDVNGTVFKRISNEITLGIGLRAGVNYKIDKTMYLDANLRFDNELGTYIPNGYFLSFRCGALICLD